MMKFTAIKGRYKPNNPSKYDGDINKITYRSLWERRFMLYCDRSPKIFQWSSEELHIPYLSSIDDKIHNYYPDFMIKTIDGRTIVVEIKPAYQKKWKKNQDKWFYAESYCQQNQFEFKVLTEHELF